MSGRQSKEILVVDDEPLIRIFASDVLAAHGLVTWEASNAEEALDVLVRRPTISLLFTDVNMPGAFDGVELARRVHQDWPHVELVVTSGAVTIPDEELPDHGTFLPKPYPASALVEIVSKKLRRDL